MTVFATLLKRRISSVGGYSEIRQRERDVPLGVTTFELPSEQVTEPSLEERNDTSEEEEPNSPTRSPETDTRTFTDGSSVESSVDLQQSRISKIVFETKDERSLRNSRRASNLYTFGFASSTCTCNGTYQSTVQRERK